MEKLEAVYQKLVNSMGKQQADELIKKLDLSLDKNPVKVVTMLKMGSNFL